MVEGSEKELSNFNDWLQCYMQDGMKNLVDRNGSKCEWQWLSTISLQTVESIENFAGTIWFSGDPGPMKPANGKSRSPTKGKKRSKKEPVEKDHDYTSPVKVKKEVEVKQEEDKKGVANKKSSKKTPNKVTPERKSVENGTASSPLKTRSQRKR